MFMTLYDDIFLIFFYSYLFPLFLLFIFQKTFLYFLKPALMKSYWEIKPTSHLQY